MSPSSTDIRAALSCITPPPGPERLLAQACRRALSEAGILHDVESQIAEGRLDMRVGPIAIELKVRGSSISVIRQLSRYADDHAVTELILVTTSAKLKTMPSMLGGKPLWVVYLLRV